MCKKCSSNSCSGCSGSFGGSAQTASDIAVLQVAVEQVQALVKFLNGHPIIALDDPSDVVLFSLTTGVGSGNWIGWGICDGTSYAAPSGTIATPDLRDKFIVGSQGTYAIGDTGGFDSITLDTTMIPSHTHAITDPGHTHVIVDPGHDHNVTDPGHDHSASVGSHQHVIEDQVTDASGVHNHDYVVFDPSGSGYNLLDNPSIPPGVIMTTAATLGSDTDTTTDNGSHTHTYSGLTNFANAGTVVNDAFTGIDMDDAFTGISNNDASTGITISNTGGGLAHENRPPYYALLFVKKIF